MKKAGELLKEERIRKGLSKDEIASYTKIKKDIITQIENSEFSKLPPTTFIEGFVKSYAKFLRVDEKKIVAVLRRESVKKEIDTPLFVSSIQKKFLTSKTFLILIVSFLGFIFFSYMFFQFQNLVSSPGLSVSSPQEGQEVHLPIIVVSGTTEPGNVILVNRQEVEVDLTGSFSQEIKLNEGVNNLEIVSKGNFGRITTLTRQVVFIP